MAKSQKRFFNFKSARQPAPGNIHYPFFRKLTTPYVANALTLSAGGSASVIADLQTENDGDYYHIDEVSATPGLNLIVKFANVLFFNFVRVKGAYVGSTAHTISIQLRNWVTASYDTIRAMPHFPNFSGVVDDEIIDSYEAKVEDSAKYINAGQVWIRIIHIQAGNPAHDLYIDYVSLY